MPTESLTVTRLADLRFGDRVKSCDGRPYSPVRVVQYELAPIEAGSVVRGVRLENPYPTSPVEHVWYPSQMDGHVLEVDRYVS